MDFVSLMTTVKSIPRCKHRVKLLLIFHFFHASLLEEENFSCSYSYKFKTRIYSPTLVPWYDKISNYSVWLHYEDKIWA